MTRFPSWPVSSGIDHQDPWAVARRHMVAKQIAGRGIRDPAVLDAMARVPREFFVPESMRSRAYDDRALPVGEGQTISQPYVVALMTEALELNAEDRVLEVGTGSGYAAAVLALIAGAVYTIESNAALAERARRRLEALELDNVHVARGDGTRGWPRPGEAPFDGIVVTAGGPFVPRGLLVELDIGGRLVIPVGSTKRRQSLVRVRRTSTDDFSEEPLEEVAFVPLVGEEGWATGE